MIKGSLVGLRAIEKEDLPFLRDWRNISYFRKHFREVRELNLADQESWFEHLQGSTNTNFMFSIVRLEDNELMGACGLLYTNWIARYADVSMYIGDEEAYVDNRGYAQESIRLLLNYGFHNLNLNKVWMELYEYDHEKLSLFVESFGFQRDGLLRQNCFEGGRYWDSHIISLLSSDFKGQ